MATQICASCGEKVSERGHRTPFCPPCHEKWEASPEYREMVTARDRYIKRVTKKAVVDETGKCVSCKKPTFGRFCKDCLA